MIVKATEQDIEDIQDIAKKSWESAYKEILTQEQIDYMLEMMYSDRELKSHFQDPNYHYYLIKEDNNALGFVGYEWHYEPQTTKLHRIYFLTEARGKGLGKLAVDFIKDDIKKIDNNRIILTVNKNNSARNFYEKLGFRVYDEGVFDIGNGYVMDDYLMELIIN